MEHEPTNPEVTNPTAAPTPAAVAPEEAAATVTPAANKRSLLFFAGIAVALVAVGGAAVWHFDLLDTAAPDASTGDMETLSEEELAAPVATVNGITVTRKALEENIEQMKQAALSQGADPNDLVVKTQIAEQAYEITINNELLKQAAEKEAAQPTDAEVDAEIERLQEQNGGAEAFAALLAQVGFTEAELRDNVIRSLHIKAYLATKQTPVSVTDAEVTEFYDSLGGEDAGLPPLEDVREQVVGELEAQKQNEQVNVLLQELRAEAEIEKV